MATEERKAEIECVEAENGLYNDVTADAEVDENTAELDCILNKPVAVAVADAPKRRDPWPHSQKFSMYLFRRKIPISRPSEKR